MYRYELTYLRTRMLDKPVILFVWTGLFWAQIPANVPFPRVPDLYAKGIRIPNGKQNGSCWLVPPKDFIHKSIEKRIMSHRYFVHSYAEALRVHMAPKFIVGSCDFPYAVVPWIEIEKLDHETVSMGAHNGLFSPYTVGEMREATLQKIIFRVNGGVSTVIETNCFSYSGKELLHLRRYFDLPPSEPRSFIEVKGLFHD